MHEKIPFNFKYFGLKKKQNWIEIEGGQPEQE